MFLEVLEVCESFKKFLDVLVFCFLFLVFIFSEN